MSIILCGASNKTIVLVDASISLYIFSLFVFFLGRKPKNKNESALKPDTESADMTAEAPGIGITSILLLRASFTSWAPGSDIAGTPASLTKTTFFPFFNSSIKYLLAFSLLSSL